MTKKLLALYGLKWNPFAPDVPVEAIYLTPRTQSFCWRVEQLAGEGGFALITGAPGTGKSVALRPNNRWGGSKLLRERWQTYIDASLSRPVLIVDEAQEMVPSVLAELRLLSSVRLDSHILLTVVLAGDGRLVDRFRSDELLPLGSRIRVRLALERASSDELQECLRHALNKAGAPKLMTPELIATLADHAQGNLRTLMNMAAELLAIAAEREARHIDEKLFLETYAQPPPEKIAGGRRR